MEQLFIPGSRRLSARVVHPPRAPWRRCGTVPNLVPLAVLVGLIGPRRQSPCDAPTRIVGSVVTAISIAVERRKSAHTFGGFLLAMIVTACGGAVVSTAPTQQPLRTPQTHTLTSSSTQRSGDVCVGTGSFSDVRAGLAVVVRDADRNVIGDGRLQDADASGLGTEVGPETCAYEFTIRGLPRVQVYSIEIGDRGELMYSLDEIERMNWRLELGN
jgi:hypothetical protein